MVEGDRKEGGGPIAGTNVTGPIPMVRLRSAAATGDALPPPGNALKT